MKNIKEILKDKYVIVGMIVIMIIGGFGFMSITHPIHKTPVTDYHQYTSYEVFCEMNILKYDSLKLRLINCTNAYISNAAPTSSLDGYVIVENCLKHNIEICFVLAQAEQESHFGTQGLARKTNSVFNVYAFDGHDYNAINEKGKYKHPNDCVEPYIVLLEKDYLVDGKTEYDLLENYVNKNGKRYASADTYEQVLYNKITKIKQNTDIDRLFQEVRKQELIAGIVH